MLVQIVSHIDGAGPCSLVPLRRHQYDRERGLLVHEGLLHLVQVHTRLDFQPLIVEVSDAAFQ